MLDIVNGKKERDSKEICTNIKFKEKKTPPFVKAPNVLRKLRINTWFHDHELRLDLSQKLSFVYFS